MAQKGVDPDCFDLAAKFLGEARGKGSPALSPQSDAAERLYLATEAADLAEVTDDPGRPDGDNWFQALHDSDKAWAGRE